jgi:hypothetical protein
MQGFRSVLASAFPVVVGVAASFATGGSYPFGINVLERSSGTLNTPIFVNHDGTRVLGWAFGVSPLENRYSRLEHDAQSQPVRTFAGSNGINACNDAVNMFVGGARPSQSSANLQAFYMPGIGAAPVYLGSITGYSNSTASLITADGQRVFGMDWKQLPSGARYASQVFTWSPTEGRRSIPRPGGAYTEFKAITADGSMAVGMIAANLGSAFVWTESRGYQFLRGIVPNVSTDGAFDVTADGSAIVGATGSADGRRSIAAIWRDVNEPPQTLVDDWYDSVGYFIADGGRIAAGQGKPVSSMGSFWWIWTAESGMIPAADCFIMQGIQIPRNQYVASIRSVTDNGKYWGVYLADSTTNTSYTAIITVPGPGASLLLAVAAAPMAARRRREQRR